MSALSVEEQLQRKYAEIKRLSDDIPAQLARKITLYSEALLLIGRLQAAATYEYGQAYAERKRVWGETMANTEGTAATKEGAAEMAAYPYRVAEAKKEAELVKWKTAFEATVEIIQALKMELKVMTKEMDGV